MYVCVFVSECVCVCVCVCVVCVVCVCVCVSHVEWGAGQQDCSRAPRADTTPFGLLPHCAQPICMPLRPALPIF
jgi:hypothetical protein